MAFQQEYKLADYFSVIGLDEELKSIDQNLEGKVLFFPGFTPLLSMAYSLL